MHRWRCSPPIALCARLTGRLPPLLALASCLACLAAPQLLAAPADAAPKAPEACAALRDQRPRMVVMGISPRRGVSDKELVAALTDVVLGVYAKDAGRLVIGPEDIRRALDWEASRQQADCDDSRCLAEVGGALDARRIVAGAIDALGGNDMVTLSEIDAITLEPVARVQEEVPTDGARLVPSLRRLAGELLREANRGAPVAMAAASQGNAGSIEITSEPRGAQLYIGGNPAGATPTRLDNVAPGRHAIRLVRTDYDTIDVAVPVHAGGTTRVNAELTLDRKIAEQNYAARHARHKDDLLWHGAGAWTKTGLGAAVAVVGGLMVLGAAGSGDVGTTVFGVATTVVGAGAVAWGVGDLATPPEAPVPEWEIERRVVITPPGEKGTEEVQVLQAGVRPGATR